MPETPDDPHVPPARDDHEAALVAAAASGELDAPRDAETLATAREYAALVAADPGVADEVARLRDALDRLDVVGSWQEPEPSPYLRSRVLALAEDPHQDPAGPAAVAHPTHTHPRLRWLPTTAAAALLLVAGAAVGALIGGREDADPTDPTRPTGPPGTLGAVERIDFTGEPRSVDIEASLVAHTWGTETVLTMVGFEPGSRYEVVLRAEDGQLEESGTFLGSEVPIDCRMNGALLREDVDAVEIRDADGSVVATSDVPSVRPG